jgi:hypothetical protein
VAALLGAWIMLAPSVFGTQGAAADSDHVAGALITTFAVIAIGQIARTARLLNVLFGAWLAIAPWLLEGYSAAGQWNSVAAGVLLIALSVRRGRMPQTFGGWERYTI